MHKSLQIFYEAPTELHRPTELPRVTLLQINNLLRQFKRCFKYDSTNHTVQNGYDLSKSNIPSNFIAVKTLGDGNCLLFIYMTVYYLFYKECSNLAYF